MLVSMPGTDPTTLHLQHYHSRRIVGAMPWVTGQTQPDLAYDICCLTMSLHEPKFKDLIKANQVLKKMQRSVVNMKFGGLTVRN